MTKRTAKRAAAAAAAAPAAATAADSSEPSASVEGGRAKRQRTNETAAAAKSARKGKGAKAKEEAAEAAQAAQNEAVILQQLSATAAAGGRLFDTALGPRPALATVFLRAVIDFLAVRDVVASLALASRSAYASCADFADARMAANNNGSQSADSDEPMASSAAAAAASSSSSSSLRAPTASSDFAHQRTDSVLVTSVAAISRLVSSRFRGLVLGLRGSCALDVAVVSQLAESLPQLQSLHCTVRSDSPSVSFVFPSHLIHLHVQWQCNSGAARGVGTKDWTESKASEFVGGCMLAVGCLKVLRVLEWCVEPGLEKSLRLTPRVEWLDPLATLTNLHTLRFLSGGVAMRGLAAAAIPLLRTLPALAHLGDDSPFGWTRPLRELLVMPHAMRLKSLPLESVILSDMLVQFVLSIKDSIEDLRPEQWALRDLSWLALCPSLHTLAFVELVEYSPPAAINPPLSHLVDTLVGMGNQLTNVRLHYEELDHDQLARLLRGLPNLRELDIKSPSLKSLEAFSAANAPRLARTLRTLKIEAPLLPRDESLHLLALLELTSLDISGSFLEPLYARQLLPFQPPYPRAPLHWLRSFTPRSRSEPVPTPPLDLGALVAAQEAFGARVQAGLVRPAEAVNAAQMTGVLQFLPVREFSVAARTCRAWRNAASIPSAWSRIEGRAFSSPSDSDSEDSMIGQAQIALPPPVSPASSSDIRPFTTSQRTRVLVLKNTAPECNVAVLSTQPLWRNTRALHLLLLEPYSFINRWQPIHPSLLEGIEAPLRAVAALTRLELLQADFSEFRHLDAAVRLMVSLGPHLRFAQLRSLPRVGLRSLVALEELDFSWVTPLADGVGCPGDELAVMHGLRRLVLEGSQWHPEVGPTLRKLSAAHALRELELRFNPNGNGGRMHGQALGPPLQRLLDALTGTTPAMVQPTFQPPPPVFNPIVQRDQAMQLMLSVLQQHNPPAFLNNASSAPPAAAAAAASSASSIDLTPAQLERLNLFISEGYRCDTMLPLSSLLDPQRLPRLRDLRVLVKCVQDVPVDLAFLLQGSPASRTSAAPPVPVLEVLHLGVEVVSGSFPALAALKNLRQLHLSDPKEDEPPYAPTNPPVPRHTMRLPSGCIAGWVAAMPNLESLLLDGVQVPTGGVGGGAGELSCLARAPHLTSLSLMRQKQLQLADLDVLAQIPQLRHLTLVGIEHLMLRKRDWMDGGVGRPAVAGQWNGEELVKPRDAAVAAAGFTTAPRPSRYPDLLALMSSCPTLMSLRWSPTQSVMDGHSRYTTARSWIRPSRGAPPTNILEVRQQLERARDRYALRQIMLLREEQRRAIANNSTTGAAASSSSSSSSSSSPNVCPPSLRIEAKYGESGWTRLQLPVWSQSATAAASSAFAEAAASGVLAPFRFRFPLEAFEADEDNAELRAELEVQRAAAAKS